MDKITVRVTMGREVYAYALNLRANLTDELVILASFGLLFQNGWAVTDSITISVLRNGIEIPPMKNWTLITTP